MVHSLGGFENMASSAKLDLRGLRCPLPVLRTRKALKLMQEGDRLEVLCTDPMSMIDIPHLVQETGDRIEILEQGSPRIVFLIEKKSRIE